MIHNTRLTSLLSCQEKHIILIQYYVSRNFLSSLGYVTKIVELLLLRVLLKKGFFVFEINEVFILTILFPSVGVFVSFFRNYCVHACVEHFIKEVLWFILHWIQKTLTKTSVWSD